MKQLITRAMFLAIPFLGSGTAVLATSGAASAAPVPVITSVTFTGTVSNPTVTVRGHGFGHQPPTGYPNNNTSCGTYTNNGDAYGADFEFLDVTHVWSAGAGIPPLTECIGIVITKWKPNEVVFGFGSAYNSFDSWFAAQGDTFTLSIKGSAFTGTVTYA